jgi:hypothetical protein
VTNKRNTKKIREQLSILDYACISIMMMYLARIKRKVLSICDSTTIRVVLPSFL